MFSYNKGGACAELESRLSTDFLAPVWSGVSGADRWIQACDFMVGDFGDDPCEPGLGVDVV